jgi:hypothetical protein
MSILLILILIGSVCVTGTEIHTIPLDIDIIERDYDLIYCTIINKLPSPRYSSFYQPPNMFEVFKYCWMYPGTEKTIPRSNDLNIIYLTNYRYDWIVHAQFTEKLKLE